MVILQNKFKYIFTLNDIINVIETAITNSPLLFAEPLRPKNPFNNRLFDDSTLYNVYFHMKRSNRVISTLLHLFFLCNFELSRFENECAHVIRDYAIKRLVFKSPAVTLYKPVMEMLRSNRSTKELIIHQTFPSDLLVSIFREFLYLYYYKQYGSDPVKCATCKTMLKTKLEIFYSRNPEFGRKVMRTKLSRCASTGSIKRTSTWTFNTKHVSFHEME